MRLAKATLIWVALAVAICVPIAAAAASPLLAWRGPLYILAGFAGIIALGLALVQPLLIAGYLPGLSAYRGRRAHHWIGGALVVAVVVHVAGLWITSPPDMIDALLFTSPTPFSPFGVIAMWAIFAVAASRADDPPLLRVGPLTVDRAEVWLALATLEVSRVPRDLEGFAGEWALVRLPFRDAM